MPKQRTGSKYGATYTYRYSEEEQYMFDIVCAIDERSRAEEFRYLVKRRYAEIAEKYTKEQQEAILKNKDWEIELNSKKTIENIDNDENMADFIKYNEFVFSKLDNLTQYIFKMRAGIDSDVLTYNEIGEKIGLTRQRVQKIIDDTIKKLLVIDKVYNECKRIGKDANIYEIIKTHLKRKPRYSEFIHHVITERLEIERAH